MSIRHATKSDVSRINVLRRQVNEVHVNGRPDIFRPGFDEVLQQHICTSLAQEDHIVLVAEDGQEITGFACIRFIDRPASPYRKAQRYLEVEELGVDEAHRRQGIGRALFAVIRDLARERGFDRLELNMWEFNEAALKFYESIGFSTYRRYMEYTFD